MSIILKAENISKQYRLGTVGTGTISHDLNRWWHLIRGKEDPYLKLGGINDRGAKAMEDYVWALRDVNFDVEQGQVLGIIGKNGAGKSTLLKLLSRVTAPTTGVIRTRGRIASLLEIGTGFHPELTGKENIFMNGAVLGMTKAEIKRNLDEIIAFSGCEKYIDTPVKRYSSGMAVRLGFAVAAHLEPEILVVDEVLAVGDAEFQKKAIGKMQDLSSGEGRTVLFVSHNMGSIRHLCSRVVVLTNGEVSFNGSTVEGISHYLKTNKENSLKSHYSKELTISSGIESIKIVDSKNQERREFGFDEEIGICSQLLIKKEYLGAFLGLRVIDKNQKVIFTSQVQISSVTTTAGQHTLKVKIPPGILVPNLYTFTLGLHIPNLLMIDFVESELSFQIVETGSKFHMYNGVDYGCVFVDCNWSLEN